MNIETSHNFRRINDKLTTSGLFHPDVLKALGAQGYEVVVNLLPDTNERAISGERDIVESQAIEYIYIPVDFKQPTQLDLARFSAEMDRIVGRKIHVHCAANARQCVLLAASSESRSLECAARVSVHSRRMATGRVSRVVGIHRRQSC